MNFEIKKIHGTPYKILFNNHEIVGVFDHGKYVSREFISAKLEHFIAEHHASTLVERLEEAGG